MSGWPDAFVRFRRETVDLIRRRWHWLTLAAIAGNLTVFAVLLVSLRALDVPATQVSLTEAFAAWALARLLGSIPITPGGIGVVELALTTMVDDPSRLPMMFPVVVPMLAGASFAGTPL